MHNVAQLRALHSQFPDELVIIGVHSAKFPSEHLTDNIRQAILREGIEHPVVNDTGFRIWGEYGVRAWPTVVLIDPRGRIVDETAGEIRAEDLAPVIRQTIEANRDQLNTQPLNLRPESQAEPQRPLSYPAKLLITAERLFIADTGHNRIVEARLDADGAGGEVTRVFGSGEAAFRDGAAAASAFHAPHGMALGSPPQGETFYVADTGNHAIRAIRLETGEVHTVAGTGEKAHGRYALGAPKQTPLRSPWALATYQEILFIAMAGSHQIWVLIGEERLGSFAGSGMEALVDGPVSQAGFNQPSDLAIGIGYLFVADPEASAIRAIRLDASPQVVTLVGEGLFEFGDRDGVGNQVRLQHPAGLCLAGQTLYLADTYNNKIKSLDPATGRVTTLAGSGQAGHADGAFESAEFFEPEGIVANGERLYIADTNNHLIRVADLASRRVSAFRLRGLERMPVSAAGEGLAMRLPEAVTRPGEVRLVLEPELPPGYKRNPDAPALVRLDGQAQPERFTADQPIQVTAHVDRDIDLNLEVTLYYCEAEYASVCRISDRRLVLPLKVSPTGEAEVHVKYPVDEDIGRGSRST